MGIHKISSLIDTAEVRKAHALTGDDLAKKQVNDSALAKIIKGEDDRLLYFLFWIKSRAVWKIPKRLNSLHSDCFQIIILKVLREFHESIAQYYPNQDMGQ